VPKCSCCCASCLQALSPTRLCSPAPDHPQECNFLGDTIGRCEASERYPGVWEVPLWELQEGDTLYGVSSELGRVQYLLFKG